MDKKTEKARVRKKIENDRHKKKYRHMNTDRDRLKENGLLRKIDRETKKKIKEINKGTNIGRNIDTEKER